jgi:hypothetical protein
MCTGIRFEDATAQVGSIDLSQVVSTDYRSDALTVLRNQAGEAVVVVIVEVQLQRDEDKLMSWPLYVAAARARYGCPATLLVFAPKRASVSARSAAVLLRLGPARARLPDAADAEAHRARARRRLDADRAARDRLRRLAAALARGGGEGDFVIGEALGQGRDASHSSMIPRLHPYFR